MVLKTVYGYRRRSIWVVLDPQKLKQRLKGGLADENYPVSHHKNLFFFFSVFEGQIMPSDHRKSDYLKYKSKNQIH